MVKYDERIRNEFHDNGGIIGAGSPLWARLVQVVHKGISHSASHKTMFFVSMVSACIALTAAIPRPAANLMNGNETWTPTNATQPLASDPIFNKTTKAKGKEENPFYPWMENPEYRQWEDAHKKHNKAPTKPNHGGILNSSLLVGEKGSGNQTASVQTLGNVNGTKTQPPSPVAAELTESRDDTFTALQSSMFGREQH